MYISKLVYSKLNEHPDWRWDSEYLCFEPLKNQKLKYIPIGDAISKSQYGISIEMNEDKKGYQIYRMNEISNMFCDRKISKFADISQKKVRSYTLHNNDILFNRTNSQAFVGRTGIFKKFDENDYTFASYLVRLVANEKIVLPEYLTAFLNTEYGVKDIKRRARISINQSNVNAEELKRIQIPILSLQQFQVKIREIMNDAFQDIKEGETLYKSAEELILNEINLNDSTFSYNLHFSKNFSEIVNRERFDADYFQPKYDEITKQIHAYKGGYDSLASITEILDKNFIPKSDQTYKYIELSNISSNGEINGYMEDIGENLPTRARRKVAFDDLIISSIEGSLESIALIKSMDNNLICSNGFFVLKVKKLKPETLMVLMKLPPFQALLKKGCSGTILTAIAKKELEQIPMPLLDNKLQNEIVKKITDMYERNGRAKRRLSIARRAIEIGIEDSESSALNYLDSNLSEDASSNDF